MRHAHHRYVAPARGNGGVIAVILVFVVGIGVGIYALLRSPSGPASRGSRPSATATPSPPPPLAAPARGGAVAPDASGASARVEGVDQEYDPRHDRTKVIARGIPLEDSVANRWTLDVSWTNAGRAVRRPSAPIFWAIVHTGPEAVLEDDHVPRLLVDGKPVDVGAGDYGSQPKQGETMEALRFSTTVDELLRAGNAGAVTVEAGRHRFDLAEDARARLRALASLVPGP